MTAEEQHYTVGFGSTASGAAEDIVLSMAPQHPATHGTLRLRITVDGDRVTTCEPLIGYMHRGVEKLFEVRDYRQILVLTNRHDWLSAFSSELGLAMAAERMLGIEVPVRAVWARTLLAELNRVLSHLMFLGTYPLEIGSAFEGAPGFQQAVAARERIQQVMEEIAGGRIHFMFNRVGGLKEDLPAGWLGHVRTAVSEVRAALPELAHELLGSAEFRARTEGVAVLSREAVLQYGVSGPIARASGVDFDLRRDDPYLAYAELAAKGTLQVPIRDDGDCFARFGLLLDQVRVSLDLADACAVRLGELPQGPVNVRLPKNLKVPEGHTYCWTENPLGINGYHLVSTGEKVPWRLKLRTASFNNISVLPRLVPGCRVGDLVAVLASMFFVAGDLDK